MNKFFFTVVLVAAVFVVDTQAQTIINPPADSTVDNFPANFSCSNNMLPTQWFIDRMLLDNITNPLGIQYEIVGTIQENITIFGFVPNLEADPPVLPPPSAILSCGSFLGNIYANFTIIATTSCATLPVLINGSMSYSMGTGSSLLRPVDTVATYTCVTGYTLTGGATRTCQDNGSWSGSDPTCDVICPDLTPPANGAPLVYSDTTIPRAVGTTANYTCTTGYQVTGLTVRTCTATGWSTGDDPVCTATCPVLTLSNGVISYNPATRLEGAMAAYSCNTGYQLSSFNTRTCQSDRTWSGDDITCQAVDCGGLTNPSNGAVDTSSGTTFMMTATYTCNTGYTPTGGDITRTCQATLTWSGAALTCDVTPTALPTIDPTTALPTTAEPTALPTTAVLPTTVPPPPLLVMINPLTGSTVDTFPATFSCSNNNMLTTQWYLNRMLLDNNNPLGIQYVIDGTIQENITIFGFFPNLEEGLLLFPPPAFLSCGTSPATIYANFTLLIPPPLLATVNFQHNVTVAEGSVATLCLDVSVMSESLTPPTPFTIGLQVSPLSTATASVDYDDIPSSLVFFNLRSQCFNVSILIDDDNSEDLELIHISPTINRDDSPNVGVNMFSRFLATITIVCSENAVRLADGVDSAQGRVELCRDGEWRSICANSWTHPDAQVACRQFGFNGPLFAYTNLYGAPFGSGGEIALTNVRCLGNETDLLQCSAAQFRSGLTCSLGGGAAIDCAGRVQPSFDIEPSAITVVEGNSVGVCVRLTGGQISVPTEIKIEWSTDILVAPYPLADLSDFETSPPLNTASRQLSLMFFPGNISQCFIVNITDDSLTEGTETLFLDIVTYPQSRRPVTITVLDNICVNGSRVCVNLLGLSVTCIPPENVCNGYPQCPDNSDETNCPEICPEGQYTCRSEGRCLNPSMRCDGYPDCVGQTNMGIVGIDEFEGCTLSDGCVPGSDSVDVLGGIREREGFVRVCVNNNRVPVSINGLSILEASLLCRESGLGQVGYPGTTINFFDLQMVSPVPYLAAVSCPDTATSLSQCNITTTNTGVQAAIVCMETAATCTDGSVRIISGDGLPSNEGRVEVCHRGVWGGILDENWTNRDAAVVCRQMGYTSQDAMPILGAVYSDEPLAFVAESFFCVGNESQLIDCPSPFPLGRPAAVRNIQNNRRYLFNVAGVRCGDVNETCSDLDVRLTYRDATGYSGQFEICKNRTWRRTCSSTFSTNDIQVACNQLFGPFFISSGEVRALPSVTLQADVISETESYFTDSLVCTGQEEHLSSCKPGSPSPDQAGRRKRLIEEGATCSPGSQPTVRCPGTPVIYVTPMISSDNAYNVENQRNTYVQCASNNNLQVVQLVFERPLFEKRDISSISSSNFVRRVIDNPVTPQTNGNYVCFADSYQFIAGSRRPLSIQVLVGQGEPEYAFLQFSIVNRERLVTIPNFATNENDNIYIQTSERLIHGMIHGRTPGVQNVSCEYIESRPIDVVRGLDRIECEIAHYNRPDETVGTTPTLIAERVRILLPLNLPFIVDTAIREPAQVAFTSPESIAVEGDDDVTICLSVISGEVTTPTNITFTTAPPEVPFTDSGAQPRPIIEVPEYSSAFVVVDYDIDTPYENQTVFPVLTLTLQPGATKACFVVSIVDDDVFDRENDRPVEQVTFSYFSSSPRVARVNLRHTLVILDNDRNCTMEEGQGSRICLNTVVPAVTCIIPSLVCNYETVECPDRSDELNCPSPLVNLINQSISVETYTNVTATVSSFAALSSNRTFLQTNEFLTDISAVFDNIANFTTTANINITPSVVTDMGQTLNSLVLWQQDTLVVNLTSRIVAMFEAVATQFAQQANLTDVFTNITVITELGNTATFRVEGAMQDFTASAGVSASITLPPELFGQVPDERRSIGVYFALYGDPALLPVSQSTVTNVTRSVGTPIVAATVGPGIDFVGLDPPVVITLGLLSLPENASADPRSARCVSWDFDTVSWITDGCTTTIVDRSTFNCSCTHLTNFAVLVDICQRAQDCDNDPTFEAVLSAISYVGVAISCLGLVITIITLLVFRKLRARDNSKYHIQLSLAILCMLIVFAVGIERVEVYRGCVLVSVLIHYFTLVAVMWMGAEALLMFQKLVIVFMRITTKFIVILSLICWLFPLILVLIPMIIDVVETTPETDLIITRNVDPITGNITGFCFLKHPGVFFGAFLGPIFAVLLFNLVIFIWVIVILVKHTRGQVKRSNEHMKPKTALRLLISISGVMFLFGLTWLFAAFTFQIGGNNTVRQVFQSLFTVFASLQGFFIFLFFCVFNKEARESWRELLSCGSYKSDLLHPSQYQNTSSAGTGTRTHKAKTGTTAASSSTAYNSVTLETARLNSGGASPLPEKRDLSNNEDRYTEIPLTNRGTTAEESVSTFKGTSGNTVEQDSSRDKVETSLSSTDETRSAEEGVSTFSPPDIVVECQVDGNEEMTPPNWSGAKPVAKARVKRYSTKKVSKHHVEEYEIDFENDESDEEVAQA